MTGLRLSGAVALVTGGAAGIGLETVSQLYRGGASVVVVDVNEDQLLCATERLDPDRVLTVSADVRDLDAMLAIAGKAVRRVGRLDIAVANAGVAPPPATLRSVEPDAFRRVIDINLYGAWNTVRACIEPVIAARGHIQLISSCASFAPGMGGAAYMISKSGVEQLGRALRIELAPHGASAGIAYFGIVETAMTHATLDDDPIGHDIGAQLPWPLNRRITAGAAASAVTKAITGRRAQVIVPRQWVGYSLLRGLINPALDARLTHNRRIADIICALEER